MPISVNAHNTLFLLNASSQVWRAIEEFHFRLAQELCNRGATVVIVLANPVPDDIRQRLESSGAIVHYLAYRNRTAFAAGLRHLVKEYAIRTVHIRFFRLTQWVSWWVRFQGIREIIYTDAEGNESTARGLKRFLKRLRTRVITAPVVRFIAISEFVKKRLVESGAPLSKIEIVYNGIDLDRFKPIEHARKRLEGEVALQPCEVLITTIARFMDVKRIDVILRACKVLKDRGVKFKLLLAGQGGPLESALRDLCQSLKLSEHVIWYGTTRCPELLLSASDIFVFASCGEAFGNVLVESLACGTPVVGANSGATSEIVIDGECGVLVAPDDATGLAHAIETLAGDAKRRGQMAEKAMLRAKQFSVANAVHNTLKVYESQWSRA